MMRALLITTMLLAAPAFAQEQPRPLGLRDALAAAVKSNPSLEGKTIDVAVSEAKIQGASGIDDFVIDASANWLSQRKDVVAGQPFQQTALDNLTTSLGIGKGLSDGGKLALRFDGNYTRTVSHVDLGGGPFDSESKVYAPGVSLSLTQPFLRGFGRDVARADKRRAKAARDVATLDREVTASNVVRDVIHAYWELAYAAEDLDIRNQSLTLAQEQLRIVQASIDAGRLAPSAAAEVQATVAAREEEVLLAEVAVSERSLDLRLLVGLEVGPGEMTLNATDRPEPVPAPIDVDAALKAALAQNPQIRQLQALGAAATIEVDVAENGLLPQLDFSASAGPTGNADTVSESLKQMGRFDSYGVQAGLVFSTPLGRNGAKGAAGAARGQLRRARLNEADLRAQVSVQVVRAANLLKSAEKRMEVLAKSTDLANVNLRSEKARFDVGRSTNFDVLRRQEELAEAQLHQARARADYLKDVAILEALTGDILPRYGIQLAKP